MGVIYDGPYAEDVNRDALHEGYAARIMPDGTLTGTWSGEHGWTGHIGLVGACDCGWRSDRTRPPGEDDSPEYEAALRDFQTQHLDPLIEQAKQLVAALGPRRHRLRHLRRRPSRAGTPRRRRRPARRPARRGLPPHPLHRRAARGAGVPGRPRAQRRSPRVHSTDRHAAHTHWDPSHPAATAITRTRRPQPMTEQREDSSP